MNTAVKRYLPECVEDEFCELRLLGVLRTSALRSSEKFACQHPAYCSEQGMVERVRPFSW
jgi:hypothetical protein